VTTNQTHGHRTQLRRLLTSSLLVAALLLGPIAAPASAGQTTWLDHSSHTSSGWWWNSTTKWMGATQVQTGEAFSVWTSAKKPNGQNYGSAFSFFGDAIFYLPYPAWAHPRCKVDPMGGSINLLCKYWW